VTVSDSEEGKWPPTDDDGHSLTHSQSLTVSDFVRSFVPSFLRSFVPSFLRSFVPSFVPSFLRSFVPSFLRSFVPSFLRSFVLSFLRSFFGFFKGVNVDVWVRSLKHVASQSLGWNGLRDALTERSHSWADVHRECSWRVELVDARVTSPTPRCVRYRPPWFEAPGYWLFAHNDVGTR